MNDAIDAAVFVIGVWLVDGWLSWSVMPDIGWRRAAGRGKRVLAAGVDGITQSG